MEYNTKTFSMTFLMLIYYILQDKKYFLYIYYNLPYNGGQIESLVELCSSLSGSQHLSLKNKFTYQIWDLRRKQM
jgi:hypothetical protein